MALRNCKQSAVLAELSRLDSSFKIVLCNSKHALNIEDNTVADNINDNNDGLLRVQCNYLNLVMSLEWQYARLVVGQVDALHVV